MDEIELDNIDKGREEEDAQSEVGKRGDLLHRKNGGD